jgi:Icc-related predicted phosphoesterase
MALILKCVSDIHGQFQNFKPSQFGKCDLIVLAGDIYEEKVPGQSELFDDYIVELSKIAPILYTPGNHDNQAGFLWHEKNLLSDGYLEHQVDRIPFDFNKQKVIISKETTSYNNPKLASRWYNMLTDVDTDLDIWSKVPYVDLVVSHSPPYGHLDKTDGGARIGSLGLTGYIYKHQPKICIVGHCHEFGGKMTQIGKTKVYNVAGKITKIVI